MVLLGDTIDYSRGPVVSRHNYNFPESSGLLVEVGRIHFLPIGSLILCTSNYLQRNCQSVWIIVYIIYNGTLSLPGHGQDISAVIGRKTCARRDETSHRSRSCNTHICGTGGINRKRGRLT